MFAVIARADMDPGTLDEPQVQHMVDVVKAHPGFSLGYWARDVEHQGRVHAVVLFDTRDHAEEFVTGVRRNLPNSDLTLGEVIAQA